MRLIDRAGKSEDWPWDPSDATHSSKTMFKAVEPVVMVKVMSLVICTLPGVDAVGATTMTAAGDWVSAAVKTASAMTIVGVSFIGLG